MENKPEIVPGHVGYSPDYKSDKRPALSGPAKASLYGQPDAERHHLVADIAAWIKKHPKLDPRIADDIAFEIARKWGSPK
jgi:hypothetical protein